MKVAASFIVPAGAVSLRSLQAYACARSRALGKKFLVTRIVGKSAYQVYREK
jgi:ABC-type glycerol-3-phosphate transport system permease component